MKETQINQGFTGSQLLFALLGGALAGAAIAMLTTPKSGPDTRDQIREVVSNGRQKARQIPSAMKNATAAAREAFTDAMEEVGS